MKKIELKNVCKSFGKTNILKNINLEIKQGEFVVFVGPSGCGKSTLLRVISGLEDLTSGSLAIDGQMVNDVPPAKRGLAMVFQSYALYPHMSVRNNIAFPLKMAGLSYSERNKKIDDVAKILNLTDYLFRKPGQLSGGQRQRVAIGRAIVREPVAFLFDEPLSNLDAALRVSMRLEITELQKKLKTTMVYVTHDQVEAMTMADRIVVLQDGIVEQVGSPSELYKNPRNKFIAGFIGSPKMNLLSGEAAEKLGAHSIGIRPEHVTASSSKGMWKGKIGVAENLGSDSFLHVHFDKMEDMVVRIEADHTYKYGRTVYLTPAVKHLHRFNEEGLAVGGAKKPSRRKPPAKKTAKK